jgi:hypothetical protein
MSVTLDEAQREALRNMHNGCILAHCSYHMYDYGCGSSSEEITSKVRTVSS